jgi:hypothetical protein
VVISAILEWTGPVLATSVKPDVIKATRAHRERRGEVVVLDPLGSSGLAGARWTPLAFCRSWAGAQQLAATIAHTADLGTLGTAERKDWKTLGQKPGAVHSNSTAFLDLGQSRESQSALSCDVSEPSVAIQVVVRGASPIRTVRRPRGWCPSVVDLRFFDQ